MTKPLSTKHSRSATPDKQMTRREQIDFHISALQKLGIGVTITSDLANVGYRAAARVTKPGKRLAPLKAAIKRMKPYVGRTMLHSLVDENDRTITERLVAMGYIERSDDHYLLTGKGKMIGRQNGNRIELHVEKSISALNLTKRR